MAPPFIASMLRRYSLLSPHKTPHSLIILRITAIIISIGLFQVDSSIIFEWEITRINSASISLPIIIEAESILFLFTICFISFNVLIFSKFYIIRDINLQRFTHIVILFIISIIILILTPNLITILLGWDGLGITRFLLVIYYDNSRSLKSGFITLISNRIGDCFILLSIALTISQGHWNILNIWTNLNPHSSFISTLILFAAITKRAQFPFIAWLTCAIAAPTPVSALVHSSTLVTAGVFIIIRFYPILSQFEHFNIILITTGSITIFLSAFWAITKKDIKEVVALSTISQLGLITTTLSFGLVEFTFFHILTHAIFKATIFIAVGATIIFKDHRQNFRNLKLKKHSRTIGATIVISILSINAIFFLAGFYSKDQILEIIWYSPNLFFTVLLFFPATALTITYSTRIWRRTFSTKPSFTYFFFSNLTKNKNKRFIINNNLKLIEAPLVIITIISVVIGATTYWLINTPGNFVIVTTNTHLIPPSIVLIGWFIAAGFCPSNKAKILDRTVYKLKLKYLIKAYKAINKILPSNIQINTNLHIKIKIKLQQKHTKEFQSKKLIFKTKITCDNEVQGSDARAFNCAKLYVNYNYKLAKPFLSIAFIIEKTLDIGLFILLGPNSITKLTTNKRTRVTTWRKIKIKHIWTFIVIIFILPTLLYIPPEETITTYIQTIDQLWNFHEFEPVWQHLNFEWDSYGTEEDYEGDDDDEEEDDEDEE